MFGERGGGVADETRERAALAVADAFSQRGVFRADRSPYLGVAFLTLMVSAFVWTQDPLVLEDPPVAAAVIDSDTAGQEAGVARLAPSATAAASIVVADPRPGDLRFSDDADVLPVDYSPLEAAGVLLDVAYGTDPAQQLDLYLPGDAAAPVIVFLHAGGWLGGDEDVVPDLALRFVERGYAVASVGYRLSPDHPFPAPVTDVKQAVRWLKASGATTGMIDGSRIVLMGTSAGGHLAAFAGATPGEYEPSDLSPAEAAHDSTVAGVVSIVGPTDLVQLYGQPHNWARSMTAAFVGCDPCSSDELAVASVAPRLHADIPPAYWAYGAEDALVEVESQAVATAAAWAAQGGEDASWIDIVEGGDHNLDESQINMRALEEFVDRAVGLG